MSADSIAAQARRYLLDEASDEDALAFERQYFEDQGTLEAIAAAEDDLIEDYLDGLLKAAERVRFERVYLVSPAHRLRVDTIRRLRETAAAPMSDARLSTPHAPIGATLARRPVIPGRLLALAAVAVIALTTSIALWSRTHRTSPPGTADAVGPVATRATPPHVFAFAIPADALRGSGDAVPILVIPPDTDVVALEIPVERGLSAATATVATVGGEEVWRSAATTASPNQVRIEVPAARLRPDDYIVTLMSDTERETGRYALHVRAR